MGSTTVWIIVALVVIAMVALFAVLRQRSASQRQQKADAIRREAQQNEVEVRKREAEARHVDAKARTLKAEADLKAAEADELAATARARESEASHSREALTTDYERADTLDPRTTDGRSDEPR